MFPTAPSLFVLTLVIAAAVTATVGFSWLWTVFAITLVVTTIVAVIRSIPRKER